MNTVLMKSSWPRRSRGQLDFIRTMLTFQQRLDCIIRPAKRFNVGRWSNSFSELRAKRLSSEGKRIDAEPLAEPGQIVS